MQWIVPISQLKRRSRSLRGTQLACRECPDRCVHAVRTPPSLLATVINADRGRPHATLRRAGASSALCVTVNTEPVHGIPAMERSVSPDLHSSGPRQETSALSRVADQQDAFARGNAPAASSHAAGVAIRSVHGPAVPVQGSAQPLVRLRYSPVRVSISILSPVLQKSGTWTSNPVLSLAGFKTLPDVSPRTAGSV